MAMTARPLPPLLSWAPATDVVRFLALYLAFPAIGRPSTSLADSSLLHFSRTCRLVHAAVTSDPRCWAGQTLVFDLHEPILHPLDFVLLPAPAHTVSADSSRAKELRRVVRVDRLTPRRQLTMRRLIGEAAFEHVIAPTLLHTQLVIPPAEPSYDVDDFFEDEALLASTRAEAELGRSVSVYSQLHVGVFRHAAVQPQRLAVSEELEPLPSYNFGGLWIYGCYCFLLLPSTVRFIKAARVSFQLAYHRDPVLQLDCLYRLLDRTPGLMSLRLEQPALVDDGLDGPLFSWRVVHRLLPALRHLTIRGAAMEWHATLRPLLTLDGASLCAVDIDTTRVFVVGEDEDMQWDYCPMRFRWPPLDEAESELAVGSTASTTEALRLNRELRLALCRHVSTHLRELIGRVAASERLSATLADCEAIESSLDVVALASGQGRKRPRSPS
jgi:hypothetical protein